MVSKNKIFFQIVIVFFILFGLFLTPSFHQKVFAATTITTCEELQAIPDGDTGDYLLGGDINCSSIANFTPIANFGGTFDGQNNTISSLTINSSSSNIGLFGVHGQDISISNLTIIDADITGGSGTGCFVGGYSFMNSGGTVTLNNVHCSGSITSTSPNVGGLVGSMRYIDVSNSSFTGIIGSPAMNGGGLIGSSVEGVSVIDSNFNGDINGGMNIGGIIGSIQCWISSCANSITDSYSSGSITSSGMNSGGILGGSGSTTIENCHSDITINGQTNVGGIAGSSSGDIINKSYSNSSLISGSDYDNIGGLVGRAEDTTITKSYSVSTLVSGSGNVGGLIGYLSGNSVLTDCYTTSNVSADSYEVGGLVGYAENFNISQNYSTGIISVNDETVIGGLIGKTYYEGNINNSFTISKDSLGIYFPLIGDNDSETPTTINNSYDALTTDISNFSNYSFAVYDDWNFTDIWSNIETYPTFIWQHVSEPTSTPTPTPTATPTSVVTQSSNSDSSPSSGYTPPACTDLKPIKTPDLFQINTSKNSSKLFFTPTDTNQYYISFSTNPNAEENGESVTLAREGVQSHTIYFLKPKTTYYVKVRSQNGCMPGDWSNIMKFTTGNSIYYKNTKFVSTIKNVQSKSVSLIKSITKDTKQENVVPTPTVVKETKVESKTENVSTTTTDSSTKSKKCFLWWCW